MSFPAFTEAELQPRGSFVKCCGWPDVPRRDYPISPRENLRRCLKREGGLWFPSWTTDILMLNSRVLPDTVARAEVRDLGPEVPIEGKGGPDMFGIPWVFVPEVGGSMEDPKTPHLMEDANDWERAVTFPDPDRWDWDACKAVNAPSEADDRAHFVTFHNGMFERLISFMGFENAVMALIDEDQQDAVLALFDRLADLYIDLIRRHRDCYYIDGVHFHDDWGNQRAPMFSCETCEDMVVPAMKKIADFCHANDMLFVHHSCGKNERMVPAMVAEGDDMWIPQPMNDVDLLRAQYGDKLMLGVQAPRAEPGDDEAAFEAKAKAFVEKYAPDFRERPIFLADFAMPRAYKDAIYKFSRLALQG